MIATIHLERLLCRHNGLQQWLQSLTLRNIIRCPVQPVFVRQNERIAPLNLDISLKSISHCPLTQPSAAECAPSSQTIETLGRKITEGVRSILAETYLLLWKGKNFKGCFIPSKWKWYHRHGYWATRKKLLKFDTYRRHRYHEVRGPGKRPPSKWEDQSFYKPLRDSVKFW